MNSDQAVANDVLFYTQLVTGFLLLVSEYLGVSSCEYNGIAHFVFLVFKRKIYVDVRVEKEEKKNELPLAPIAEVGEEKDSHDNTRPVAS